jgi:hypothetical protein
MKMAGEAAPVASAPSAWPRRVLVTLWFLAFLLAGLGLASRWDVLMSQLARPPASGSAAEGALR